MGDILLFFFGRFQKVGLLVCRRGLCFFFFFKFGGFLWFVVGLGVETGGLLLLSYGVYL